MEGLDVAAAEFRWLVVRMLSDLSGAKGGEDGQRSSFATDFVLMVACHRQQAWLPGKYLVSLCSCWMNCCLCLCLCSSGLWFHVHLLLFHMTFFSVPLLLSPILKLPDIFS